MYYLIFLVNFLTLMALAAEPCDFYAKFRIATTLNPDEKFKGFIDLGPNSTLYVEYNPASNPLLKGELQILEHGIMDGPKDMDYQRVGLLRQGYPLLMVEHQLHGNSLRSQLITNSNIPYSQDYKPFIQDQAELVRQLRPKSVQLIGHSLGGGIIMPLANELSKFTRVKSIIPLGGYPVRLDEFSAEKLRTGAAVLDLQEKFINSVVPIPQVEDFLKEFFAPWRAYLAGEVRGKYLGQYQIMQAMKKFFGIERALDVMLDPLFEVPLVKMFREYLYIKAKKENKRLSESEKDFIEQQIKGAMAVMRGMREFNGFSMHFQLPIDIPVQIVAGDRDEIVPFELIEAFANLLASRGNPVRLIELKGANHFFPRVQPKLTNRLIREGQNWAENVDKVNGSPVLKRGEPERVTIKIGKIN